MNLILFTNHGHLLNGSFFTSFIANAIMIKVFQRYINGLRIQINDFKIEFKDQINILLVCSQKNLKLNHNYKPLINNHQRWGSFPILRIF